MDSTVTRFSYPTRDWHRFMPTISSNIRIHVFPKSSLHKRWLDITFLNFWFIYKLLCHQTRFVTSVIEGPYTSRKTTTTTTNTTLRNYYYIFACFKHITLSNWARLLISAVSMNKKTPGKDYNILNLSILGSRYREFSSTEVLDILS